MQSFILNFESCVYFLLFYISFIVVTAVTGDNIQQDLRYTPNPIFFATVVLPTTLGPIYYAPRSAPRAGVRGWSCTR